MTALFFTSSFLAADDPRSAPKDLKEFSPNHHFFLTSKIKENRTQVFLTNKPLAVLWEVPTYIQIPDLSDDGRHIAASYEGGNILDNNVHSSDTLITFYNSSGFRRIVTVGEVVGMWKSCDGPHPVSRGDESSVSGLQAA